MFNVTIASKNKNSINDFFLFFNKNTRYKLNSLKKYFQKNMEKKKLTILKSPHVNKKAQEQFESRLFKKQFTVQTKKNLKYLIFLKRFNYDLFPDVDIKLKYIITSKDTEKLALKVFNPNYFKINKYYGFKANNLNLKNLNQLIKKKNIFSKFLLTRKTTRLLKIFDLYGEFFKYMFE
jgi:ribosomal protein S10